MRTMPALALAAVLLLLVQLPPAPAAAAAPSTTDRLDSTVAQDLRAVAWRPVTDDTYALIAGDGGTLLRYTGRFFMTINSTTTSEINGIGWNPSGTRALMVGRDGTMLEYDGTGVRSAPQNGTFWFEDVKWRPQGDFALVVGRNGTLMRTDGSSVTRLNSTVNETIVSISWRPDGRFAFLCGDFTFVLRYDPETGDVDRLATGPSGQYLRGVSWRPDGGEALVFGTLGTLYRYDGAGFTPLGSPTANQWLAGAWSPDNRTALLAARAGLLYRYEEGKNQTALETNTTGSIYSIAYMPNGSYALCVGSGGLVLRYPPAETPGPVTPTGGNGTDWLLLSAVLLMTFALITVGLAVFLASRSRKRRKEADELAEAELHAAEVAAARSRSKGSSGKDELNPMTQEELIQASVKALATVEKEIIELDKKGIDTSNIKQLYEQARATMLIGDYPLARELLNKALSKEPAAESAIPVPKPDLNNKPQGKSRLSKRVCPVCKRVFAVEVIKPETPVTCPWCDSPQK
jgi:hypothetical protein